MKKSKLFAVVFAAALVGCSSDSLVDNSVEKKAKETPIGFSVQKQNITRAATLQSLNHYNFGVWAYKTVGSASQLVMDNYLVGYGDDTNKKGYDHTGATTWASATSSTSDHTSPWFYEGLGTSEYTYTGTAGYYMKTDADYMSKNANQYLRYWDYNSTKTDFYCYAPYDADGVTFDESNKKMTFAGNKAIRDGYDNPVNSDYKAVTSHPAYDRSLSELMVAGATQAKTLYPNDVDIIFKHLGAQLQIRFYENIPGYRVRIINLSANSGTMQTGTSHDITITNDMSIGIQATPAVKGSPYTVGEYYTQIGGEVSFSTISSPTFTLNTTTSTKVKTPLMFAIPDNSEGNLTSTTINTTPDKSTATNTTFDNLIWGEGETDGTNQKYSYSPTIYYPVAQPTTSATGFTFHVTYEIIAEDNGEVTTIHNATVFVPANDGASTPLYIAAWQPNTKYTYTFKITKDSSGTTDPGTTIDPTDPTPSTVKSLYPIVFDNVTIEDYTTVEKEYNIN